MTSAVKERLDFYLTVAGDFGTWRVQALTSVGEKVEALTEPLSQQEIGDLWRQLTRRRSSGKDNENTLRSIGIRLYEVLFHEEIEALWRQSVVAARQQESDLRLVLAFGEAADDLSDLPLELLYDPHQERFLFQSERFSLLRVLRDAWSGPAAPATEPPLRVLVVAASPRDAFEIDDEAEWRLLQQAIGVDGEAVALHRLSHASLKSLNDALESERPHVVHFITPLSRNSLTGDSVLLLEDETGDSYAVSTEQLAKVLLSAPTIRLVYLTHFVRQDDRGARPVAPIIARDLTRRGIAAAVAPQFWMADRAGLLFLRLLYSGLARGLPIDENISEVRRRIVQETGLPQNAPSTDFAAPVLYTTVPDGQLWEITQPRGQVETAEAETGTGPSPVRTTSPTLYALLVGIDDYLGGLPRLRGCVNDARRMYEFLQERTRGGDYVFDALLLTAGDGANQAEQKPTRQAIIDGFRNHLGRAREGDVALFYYSGSGSQEKAPPEFWPIEPDHLDETIVCYDSRTEGGWDLADKELAVLIAGLARNNAHVVVILDSCHSGSGTRAAEGTDVRLTPTHPKDRPLDSFIEGVVPMVEAQVADLASGKETAAAGQTASATGDWFTLPEGRHVLMSACRPEELAHEKTMGDEVRGIFSFHLLETLRQVGPSLTYRDLSSRVRTLVRNTVHDQNPVLEATDPEDLSRSFLDGAIVEQRPYFDVTYDRELGWVIDAGTIHGIAPLISDETTELALFPLEQPLRIGMNLDSRIGDARVTEVLAGRSRVEVRMLDGTAPDPAQVYRGVIVATPLAPVAVYLAGDDEEALRQLEEPLAGSLIVQVVQEEPAATIIVAAHRHEAFYGFKLAGDRTPLHVEVRKPKGTQAAVVEAVAKVEHMARWLQLVSWENRQSQLPGDAVTMEFYRLDPQTGNPELLDHAAPIELLYDPATERGVRVQLRLRHTGSYPERLYCMLLDLPDDFSVDVSSALFGSGVWLEPNQEVWAKSRSGNFIFVFLPDKLRERNVRRIRDVLKLIISTDESDASLLAQGGIEVVLDENTRGPGGESKGDVPANSFHRMIRRFETRTAREPLLGRLSDWRTFEVSVTTRVPEEYVEVPPDRREAATLVDRVKLQGHPALRARAAIMPFDEGTRDLGNLALPALFRTHPELGTSYDFGRGDAGASVIVLRDVEQPDAVTVEEPLVIRAQTTALGDDGFVLPVAFDPESELFLPLGYWALVDYTIEIRVERLPAPTADSRDVKGSIKLFLYRLRAEQAGAQRFGPDAEPARLAAAVLDEAGQVQYDASPTSVQQKVASAQRILLYVHGIVGNTRGMVASAYGLNKRTETPLPRLADRYDLILAWEYDNVNTPIAETAVRLKEALAGVGLSRGHGKTLHVVAHSSGCLVTRWFVEREGGRDVVQKAILVGPPNAGTPLNTLRDYALIGLGAALNGIAALSSPLAAVPAFLGMLSDRVGTEETVDPILDELRPGSSFFNLLDASADPGVPYVVVAGNISAIADADPVTAETERKLLEKLVDRLASPRTRHNLLNRGFFDGPNDMAVTVQSMMGLPPNRSPAPIFIEVACDHSSYFNTDAVVRAIAEQLLSDDGGITQDTRHALCIGINRHRMTGADLRYARRDAERLARSLLDPNSGGYVGDQVQTLLDEQATREGVRQAFANLANRLAGRSRRQTVVISFSGHALDAVDDVVLLFSDSSTTSTQQDQAGATGPRVENGIAGREWARLCSSLPADVVYIHDSDYGDRLPLPDNTVIIAACDAGEHASERWSGSSDDSAHGTFTGAILDVLTGANADAPGATPGTLGAADLYELAYARVVEVMSNQRTAQHPVFRVGARVSDPNVPVALSESVLELARSYHVYARW